MVVKFSYLRNESLDTKVAFDYAATRFNRLFLFWRSLRSEAAKAEVENEMFNKDTPAHLVIDEVRRKMKAGFYP